MSYKTVLYHGLKYLVSIAKEQIPKEVDEVVDDPFLKRENILQNQAKKTESKISLIEENGVFSIKATIGGKVLTKFILDSGAGECNISSDLEKKLIENGIIKNTDYLNSGLYKLADGTIIENRRVKISKILIGNKQIKNVIVSIGPSNSPNLLGQSFLNKLDSWSIDNSKKILIVH
ncbi:MAG: retroviral-like aspartic protease family protein [Chitinophagaceae bacterium]|nr:retroviral-like aspartic protease family protein [Chitinophagaceae bacterium]